MDSNNISEIDTATNSTPAKSMKFSINYLLQKTESTVQQPEPNSEQVEFPIYNPTSGAHHLMSQFAGAHATAGFYRQISQFAPLNSSLQSLLASQERAKEEEKGVSPREWGDKMAYMSPMKSPSKGYKRSSSADMCLNVQTSQQSPKEDLSPNDIFGKSPSPSDLKHSPPRSKHSPGLSGTHMHPTSRKLGRNPRVPFSSAQVAILEQKYQVKQYLSSIDVAELSTMLSLNDSRVKIWFQNRRARARKEQQMGKSLSASANPNVTITKNMSAQLQNLQTQPNRPAGGNDASAPGSQARWSPSMQSNFNPQFSSANVHNNNNNNNNHNNHNNPMRPQLNLQPFSPFLSFCNPNANPMTSQLLRPPIGQLLASHNSSHIPPNAFASSAMNLAAQLIQTSRSAQNSNLVDSN